MHDMILIEKYSQKSPFWENLIRFNKTSGSVEAAISQYNGFEGELLLYTDFSPSNLNDFMKFYEEIQESTDSLLLHALTNSSQMPAFLKNKVDFIGYDVGVCDEEKTIYSSIFNEILFGNLPELINFNSALNENLLFQSRDLAEEYLNLHNELSKQNKGVEDYEELKIYEIWKQRT